MYSDKPDSNIINSFVINDNIENLRFMFVYYDKGVYDIKLNVSQITPENLRVFSIYILKDDVYRYGIIDGNKRKVNRVKQKLIH